MLLKPCLHHQEDAAVPDRQAQAEGGEGSWEGPQGHSAEEALLIKRRLPFCRAVMRCTISLVPHQRQHPGRRCLPHRRWSSGHKEDVLWGHMLHAQQHCQAWTLFLRDTVIISPSGPGEPRRPARLQFGNGFHSCKLEDDPICLFHFCLLSYIPLEICIRGSVMGCIKYATGLCVQIGELQNWRTAVPVILGFRWWRCGGAARASKGSCRFLLPQTQRPFSKRLVPKAGDGGDIYAPPPPIFSQEPGATHPPGKIPDGERNWSLPINSPQGIGGWW